MFCTIKNEDQRHRVPRAEPLNKLYERINKSYKTINRELINNIVNRIDEITDMYYNYVFPDMSDKDKKHTENALLTKRI